MNFLSKIKTLLAKARERRFGVGTYGLSLAYLSLLFVYLELLLHFFTFGSVGVRIVYAIFFSLAFAGVLSLISALLPQKGRKVVVVIVVLLLCILYETQLIYRGVFGSFMPIAQIALGKNAVENFTNQILYCIRRNILPFLLLLLPVVLTLLFAIKSKLLNFQLKLRGKLVAAAISVGTIAIALAALLLTNSGPGSAYRILTDSGTATDNCVKNVGLLATTLQEAHYQLFGDDGPILNGVVSGEIVQRDEEEFNVDPSIDFTQLPKGDADLEILDRYFAGKVPTKKNEYTGLLQGYNVIMLCAESYSPYLISPELTPTLYKLSTNGFVFENFYCSFPNTTTAGEYAFCMGLMPDMYRSKVASSFDASSTNYLPYCMGNVFGKQALPAYAYHDYYGSFYNRNITHANMGYDFKAVSFGLDIPLSWPASDKDMIDASTQDFIASDDPFCVYYMTFSGHYEYDWSNAMSSKNRHRVQDLDYSEEVKAYLACNLELEDALTSLLAQLEAAGQADNTIIVLTADHYPYGLQEEQYNELAGKAVDTTFGKFQSSFICYVPGMEPVAVPDYCSTIDILPTLLNLLGVDYDSRLLTGRDVLAHEDNLAILSDHSYITDSFRYDAATATAIANDGGEVDAKTVAKYCDYVSEVFEVSTAILDTDYYSHVFGVSGGNREQAYMFEDVHNIYMSNGISFVCEKGYMTPDSDTVFGAERTSSVAEFIDCVYRIEGSPKVEVGSSVPADSEYPEAAAWAISNGLLTNEELSQTLNYKFTAILICRYMQLQGNLSAQQLGGNDALYSLFPALTQEEVDALLWCNSEEIINGNEGESIFAQAETVVVRKQVASYIMRICSFES